MSMRSRKSCLVSVLTVTAIVGFAQAGCSSSTETTSDPGTGGAPIDGSTGTNPVDSGHPLDASTDQTTPRPDAGTDATTPTDSGHGDSSSTDGSTPTDSGPVTDSATDGSATDSAADAAGDAGRDAASDGGALACTPGDVSSFVPAWKPPIPFQTQCTGAQITNFYTYCLGPNSNTTQCTNFQNANPACTTCLLSSESSSTYGAVIVLTGGYVVLNVPGCVYNANAAHHACAQSLQASYQCQEAACKAPCTGLEDPAFGDCTTAASNSVCSAYTTQANCVNGITNLDPDYGCFPNDFATGYTTIANAFCGP